MRFFIVFLLLSFSTNAFSLPPGTVEKAMKQSPVVRLIEKSGVDFTELTHEVQKLMYPTPSDKITQASHSKPISKPTFNPASNFGNHDNGGGKVWVQGRSLAECMGKNKRIDNNVVQFHNGYFRDD